MNKKSFGLTEIVVSAVILSAVMAGFFATFTATRKYVNISNKRIAAVNYIRSNLSSLYNDVRQDRWNNSASNLSPGGNRPLSINAAGYSGNYSVIDLGNYRQVTINVNYLLD